MTREEWETMPRKEIDRYFRLALVQAAFKHLKLFSENIELRAKLKQNGIPIEDPTNE